jgi:hypothetical protein
MYVSAVRQMRVLTGRQIGQAGCLKAANVGNPVECATTPSPLSLLRSQAGRRTIAKSHSVARRHGITTSYRTHA